MLSHHLNLFVSLSWYSQLADTSTYCTWHWVKTSCSGQGQQCMAACVTPVNNLIHNTVGSVCSCSVCILSLGGIVLNQAKLFVLCLFNLVVVRSLSVVMFTYDIVVFLECFPNLSLLLWDLWKGLTDSFTPEEEVFFFFFAVCGSPLCDRVHAMGQNWIGEVVFSQKRASCHRGEATCLSKCEAQIVTWIVFGPLVFNY